MSTFVSLQHCRFFLVNWVNCKYDVMVILVFGFSIFYQYWLLILLQYQSPWANKTHTFNLLLLRKGGWLVAALKKSTERRLVWKDAIFYWCQFSSSWWNELVKKRKVGSPTYFLLCSGSSLLEEGLLECKTLWLLTYFELPKEISSSLLHPFWHERK